ncbi:metal-dependent hydrolase [Salinirubellus salinus]|uniref:Metal-dependent hydrolase n=1 Tax=Salinirubellus salinus TaxID=1364945 RepID=A0A9E7UAB7_9EURY|nr:metal-dependent hydrolase [Salinirubellus salinus]UWM56821.1 metal-dependent hydrolase [Salinirubellus salinus]
MPDLLAHALAAYALGTALSWRYDWLTPAYVTVAMAGAFVPDLAKIRLAVHQSVIVEAIGRPFSWDPLHYLGGVVLSVLVGVLVVAPGGRQRVRVLALLSLGAATHLFLDALLRTPSGRAFPVFWPLTTWRPPTPGLYLSTEPWPTLFFAALALVVWYVDRQRGRAAADRAVEAVVDD